jgi:hypothetical protein
MPRFTYRLPGALAAALLLFAAIGCIIDGKQASRRGSEVENEVYGVLVSADGAPVAGARVKAIFADTALRAAGDTDSVLTDGTGRYAFLGLPAGTYDLLGDFESGKLVVRIPGVEHADTLGRDSVGIDTLRAPGRIRGRLLLGERGFGGALAYLPGTSYLAVSDDSGFFLITGVPQGRYGVRYSASGFLIDPDTGVFVPSGGTAVLPTKRLAYDPADPPPAPEGLEVSFDTLRGRASLSWRPVAVSDLDGYLVYRDMPGRVEPLRVPGGFVGDTAFVDSTLGDPAAYPEGKITYRVKARDKEANASLSYSDVAVARAAPRGLVETSIGWIGRAEDADTVALGDTLLLSATYSNPTRLNTRLAWSQSGRSEPLAIRPIASREGRDSLAWTGESEGEWTVTLAALDDGGMEWTQARKIRVFANGMRALAGPDTTVSVGDSLDLTAGAASRFGRYAGWEWDLGGTGAFQAGGPGRMAMRAPRDIGMYPCVLRVVDAFGDTALDTARVRVIADVPTVNAFGDTTVSLGDTVNVRASAVDGFGRVVKWEWRVGGDAFLELGPEARLAMPRAEHAALPVIVRVTDDDGQRAEDTVRVKIVSDPPRVRAQGDTTVSLGDTVRVQGSGSDGFGSIVKWEWRAGLDGAFQTGSPSARFAMPRTANPSYPILLRATDDDGQTALDTVWVEVLEAAPKAEATGGGTVSLNDTLRLEGAGSDLYGGRVTGYAWACGPSAPFTPAGPGRFLALAPGAPSPQWPCILQVIDDDGLAARDTVWFNVVRDSPTAIASAAPAQGAAGDTVRLSSAGSGDLFGRIVRWEWDVGAKGVFRMSKADTAIVLPGILGTLPCILRVTDDDGQSHMDTVNVTVNRLRVDAGPDTAVANGGKARLHGKVLPGFGTVAKWEWDIGGSGTFRTTSSGDTVLSVSMAAKSFLCVLRATNTLGFPGLDTVNVAVTGSGRLEWEAFALPASIGARSGAVPVEFQGKLWLIGGRTFDVTNEIWSSADGVNWVLRGNAAWAPRHKHSMVAFAGRLWLTGGTEIKFTGDGTSDVWSSADGLKWEKAAVTSPFPKRSSHVAFVWQGRMCVTGGSAEGAPNGRREDLWCSQDGLAWKEVNAQLPFHWYDNANKSTVLADGRWAAFGTDSLLWTSADGVAWDSRRLAPDSSMGFEKGLLRVGNELWLLADKSDGQQRGIWKIGSGSDAKLSAGPPILDMVTDEYFIEFNGLPWIWATADFDGTWKSAVYRLVR